LLRTGEQIQYVLETAFNTIITHVPSHCVRQWWLRALGVQVGPTVSVFRGVTVQGSRGIVLDEGVVVGWRTHLDGRGGLHIGAQTAVASDVHLITAEHRPDSPTFEQRNAPIKIGVRAWLATRSMVLPGVMVGDGAVVAAGAVVRTSVEPYAIVGGVPARTIGQRERDLDYRRTSRPLLY
jgi:acetyltransferase-like isoleucine patch superfamily enzyme